MTSNPIPSPSQSLRESQCDSDTAQQGIHNPPKIEDFTKPQAKDDFPSRAPVAPAASGISQEVHAPTAENQGDGDKASPVSDEKRIESKWSKAKRPARKPRA